MKVKSNKRIREGQNGMELNREKRKEKKKKTKYGEREKKKRKALY
jgi:hypothetical protein